MFSVFGTSPGGESVGEGRWALSPWHSAALAGSSTCPLNTQDSSSHGGHPQPLARQRGHMI